MKNGARILFALASPLGAMVACSTLDGAYGDSAPPTSAIGGSGTSGGLPPGENTNPPEQEVAESFRVPVVSGHWVWSANPTSGRVALIDAKRFTVRTALAGAGPTYLTALPAEGDASRALVISSLSHDATLLSAGATGEIEVLATLPVHEGANAWAVTPSGRFAIAWTDASAVTQPDPSQGFQDITVFDLTPGEPSSKRLSVGYRPARVFVDDDDRYVYVATDAGIDVVDLRSDGGPIVDREIELSARPASDTARREVNITPGGDFAFVRRDGQSFITVVDLARSAFKDIELPGVVTDLDLTPDATLAVAIVRERLIPAENGAGGAGAGGQAGQGGQSSRSDASGGLGAEGGAGVEVGGAGAPDVGAAGAGSIGPSPEPSRASLAVLMPVGSIFDAPETFESFELDDEVFGSVELGAQSATALLFTNVVPSTHLTLLGLESGAHRTVDLKLPVVTAVSSPDGAHAIALLAPPAGSKQPGAFAVVPVAKNLPPKLQGTLATTANVNAPALVAIGDERALITVSNGRTNVSYLVSMPELTVDTFELDSEPLPRGSGLVPDANQAFVAQRHPEGRITFIDLQSKQRRTLTGFELSAKVGQ